MGGWGGAEESEIFSVIRFDSTLQPSLEGSACLLGDDSVEIREDAIYRFGTISYNSAQFDAIYCKSFFFNAHIHLQLEM